METYVVNPKWYDPLIGRRPPLQDRKVTKGFMTTIKKMYDLQKRPHIYNLNLLNFHVGKLSLTNIITQNLSFGCGRIVPR